MYQQFAMVVSVSMLISALNALTLSPALCGVFLKPQHGPKRGPMKYARRETFLVDPQGKVAKRYVDVDPKENSRQVLADLAELKKKAG